MGNLTEVKTHPDPKATVLASDSIILQREGERLFESAAFLSLNFPFPPAIHKVLESIALQLNMLWTVFLNSLQRLPHNLMNVLLEGLASLIGTVISSWSLPSCFPREVSTFKTQDLSADIFKEVNNLIHKTVKYLFNHKCDYNGVVLCREDGKAEKLIGVSPVYFSIMLKIGLSFLM